MNPSCIIKRCKVEFIIIFNAKQSNPFTLESILCTFVTKHTKIVMKRNDKSVLHIHTTHSTFIK